MKSSVLCVAGAVFFLGCIPSAGPLPDEDAEEQEDAIADQCGEALCWRVTGTGDDSKPFPLDGDPDFDVHAVMQGHHDNITNILLDGILYESRWIDAESLLREVEDDTGKDRAEAFRDARLLCHSAGSAVCVTMARLNPDAGMVLDVYGSPFDDFGDFSYRIGTNEIHVHNHFDDYVVWLGHARLAIGRGDHIWAAACVAQSAASFASLGGMGTGNSGHSYVGAPISWLSPGGGGGAD